LMKGGVAASRGGRESYILRGGKPLIIQGEVAKEDGTVRVWCSEREKI